MTLFILERRTIRIGIFLFALLGAWSLHLIIALEVNQQKIALAIVLFILAILVLGIPFYLISFIWMLITSGIQLVRNEGRRMQNFLSLGLGLFLIFWAIASIYIKIPEDYIILRALYLFLTLSVYYFFFLMVCFSLASLLNRIRLRRRPYNYIIVLGSGLIGGRVPPLLASRIDKGIEIFHKHRSEKNKPILIFTGGQGADESRPEGEAMAAYAREKGILDQEMLIEDKAVNTFENLTFSKKLLEKDAKEKSLTHSLRTVIVTNNFHVFRSLLWARKVKLPCDGAGSKTKFYFWLNALIREFIGMLYMEKKSHMLVLSVFLLITITFVVGSFYTI